MTALPTMASLLRSAFSAQHPFTVERWDFMF